MRRVELAMTSTRIIRPLDNSDMHALVSPHPPSSLISDAEKWAEEIIKACNAHDKLVEVLTKAIDLLAIQSFHRFEIVEEGRQLLEEMAR
jgi:hypothetical protein